MIYKRYDLILEYVYYFRQNALLCFLEWRPSLQCLSGSSPLLVDYLKSQDFPKAPHHVLQ